MLRQTLLASTVATTTTPTIRDIEAARREIAGLARMTPLYASETLSRRAGMRVFLKAENLQRTGSFKIRGAVNRIAALTEEERGAGVVTASAASLLTAPRILNEPVRCRFSAFRTTGRPLRRDSVSDE